MQKMPELYVCELCDVNCCNLQKYNKHIATRKHLNRTELNKKKLTSEPYECKTCDFICSKQSNYNLHLLTKKHSILTQKIIVSNIFACNKCKKVYKARNSLWYHEQKCNIINNSNLEHTDVDLKQLIIEVIKSNTDLQKQNSDLQKQMMEVCKNGNTTNINSNNNNSNNKTFNLQVFLNEQCKDAMNISDFANSFELQLSDLESVGQLGYVEGMTKIIVDKLNGMDVYKRPMHCSDSKREIIYVKDENIWAREEKSNPKLRQAIKNVTFRNMKLVATWSDANPESKDHESRLNDKYMELVIQSTGGKGAITDSENKIIRRIAKEIIIEKNNHI